MSDPAGNPISIYLTLALSAITTLVLISAKLRELISPVARWFTGGAMRRMRQIDELEDARVIDLTKQVEHLTRRVVALEKEAQEHRDLVLSHIRWDAMAIAAAAKAGIELDLPPDLIAYHTPRPRSSG